MSRNLKAIKDTLRSVKNIKKITKSMEVISAIKAQKSNRMKEDCFKYLNIFKDDIHLFLKDLKENDSPLINESIFIKPNEESEKDLLIVVTSDRGLCSGYNSDIIKKAKSFIRKNNLKGTELIGIGKKSFSLTKTTDTFDGLNLISLYERVTENVKWSTIKAITCEAVNSFKSGKFKKIHVVYTKFESSLNFYPEVETLLPIDIEVFNEEAEKENPYEIDVDMETLFNEYFEKFLEAKIYKLILESAISEHYARMFTMKNADKSAADLIENLTYEYNKSRQQKITQEVAEIMAGANAQEIS